MPKCVLNMAIRACAVSALIIDGNGFSDSDFLHDAKILDVLNVWCSFSPNVPIFHCACAVSTTHFYFRLKS